MVCLFVLNESVSATMPVISPEQHDTIPNSIIPAIMEMIYNTTLNPKKVHQLAGELPPLVFGALTKNCATFCVKGLDVLL
jgi:hypothetical protein